MAISLKSFLVIFTSAWFLSGFTCSHTRSKEAPSDAMQQSQDDLVDYGELLDLSDTFPESDYGDLPHSEQYPLDDLDDFDPDLDADELYKRLQRVPPPLMESE